MVTESRARSLRVGPQGLGDASPRPRAAARAPPPRPPGLSSNIQYYMTTNGPRSSSRVCASPMRKPYAKALCTRVLLKDISTRGGGLWPPLPQRGGGGGGGGAPPPGGGAGG